MRLTDLAASLLMIDLPGPVLTEECRSHLHGQPWGGVLLFARNLETGPQVCQLMQAIEEASPGVMPLMAIDQEGGLVDRIRFAETVLSPGPMALAAAGDPEVTRGAHQILGEQLHRLGFHLDFAPCVDVNSNPDNPIIGVRSFGENPLEVARHARAACQGLRQGGVAATAKHFPGHGDCHLDSHLAMPALNHSLERLEEVELIPFRACIEAGVEAIMTAHITFPALDPRPDRPATLSSPVLQGLLREKLGFSGVIVSDSLEMQAIAQRYGSGQATLLAVEAGCDLVIVCGGPREHIEAHQALVEGVQSGRLPRQRLEEAYQRLQILRQSLPNSPRQAENPHFETQSTQMQGYTEDSITLVRQGPLPLRSGKVLLLSPDLLPLTPLGEMTQSDSVMKHLGLEGLELEEAHYPAEARGPALGKLLEAAARAEVVLFTVYARYRLPDATRELGEALLKANPQTVLVSLSSPYVLRDLPQAAGFLCSYNYTPLSLQALGRVITGSLPARGKLPVSIAGLYPAGHGLLDGLTSGAR